MHSDLHVVAEFLGHAMHRFHECRQPTAAPSSANAAVYDILNQLLKGHTAMSDNLSNLTDKVTRLETVGDSVVALLNDVSARLKAAGTDQAKLSALTSEMDTHATAWAQAVTANTPVADEPAPAPVDPAPAAPVLPDPATTAPDPAADTTAEPVPTSTTAPAETVDGAPSGTETQL